ncbi:MAG: hypothetical protein Q8Q00_05550 [Dehalococcoidia bacterium]|nr:hypothetical protein [Dehalococcoidia bacterium]
MAKRAVERPPEFLRRDARQEKGDAAALVELLLETHRVTGTVDQTGPQRRLVDLLNTTEGPMLTMRDATVVSLADPNEQPLRCQVLQVRRQSVLVAVPATVAAPRGGGLEAVKKRPAAATILLPGIEVTGQIYLPPGADPGAVPLLGRRDFLPVTDAVVTQSVHTIVRWEQPLVVVNLDRAVLYAPGLVKS